MTWKEALLGVFCVILCINCGLTCQDLTTKSTKDVTKVHKEKYVNVNTNDRLKI